jgi:hypothetical protein
VSRSDFGAGTILQKENLPKVQGDNVNERRHEYGQTSQHNIQIVDALLASGQAEPWNTLERSTTLAMNWQIMTASLANCIGPHIFWQRVESS